MKLLLRDRAFRFGIWSVVVSSVFAAGIIFLQPAATTVVTPAQSHPLKPSAER